LLYTAEIEDQLHTTKIKLVENSFENGAHMKTSY